MTYDELLKEQKMKFFKLNKMLDGFYHGFSGPDPYWDIPYPIRGKRNRWGRCCACRYRTHTGFGFANRLQAGVDTSDGKFEFEFRDVWFDRSTAFAAVDDVIAWLGEVARDHVKANNRMAKEYPHDERKGIVPRFVAERYIPDFYSIGKELGKSRSREFVKIFDSGYFWSKENAHVEDMTANKFFEYCRIAYLASEEKDDHLDRKLSGREMYARYSDGRYGALLDIDPDSTEEFMQWLDGKIPCDRHGGDHPWEIKRGGNTTHIDLYVHRARDCGWYASEEDRRKDESSTKVIVGLRGHHIGRIVETVKMFLAIRNAGLPIWIDDAESVRNRILALDNVGIIPDSSSLHRGWQEYPSDFQIADVMHFSRFGRMRKFALPFVAWKPLPVLLPVSSVPGVKKFVRTVARAKVR